MPRLLLSPEESWALNWKGFGSGPDPCYREFDPCHGEPLPSDTIRASAAGRLFVVRAPTTLEEGGGEARRSQARREAKGAVASAREGDPKGPGGGGRTQPEPKKRSSVEPRKQSNETSGFPQHIWYTNVYNKTAMVSGCLLRLLRPPDPLDSGLPPSVRSGRPEWRHHDGPTGLHGTGRGADQLTPLAPPQAIGEYALALAHWHMERLGYPGPVFFIG